MQFLPTYQLTSSVIFVLVILHLTESAPTVITAVLGEPVVLQCAGHGMALNELNIQWSTSSQVVASFSKGKFYSDPAFKNRVHLLPSKSLEEGHFSLIINRTFYSDYDTYECYQAKTLIKKWVLDITVSYSAEVRVSVGSMATLPCYSHVDRQLNSNSVHMQWMKGTMMVLDFHNGKMDRDIEYSFRTTVEVESVPKGDFSLSITDTKTSDSGVYQCLDNSHGILSSIVLDVYEEKTLKFHNAGESLKIHIPFHNDVQIEFQPSKSDSQQQWLCSVFVDWAKCKEESYSRFKYKNGLFSVEYLTADDEGKYILKTAVGDRKIKEIYVKVSVGVPTAMYVSVIILCLIVLSIYCQMFEMKHYQNRTEKQRSKQWTCIRILTWRFS